MRILFVHEGKMKRDGVDLVVREEIAALIGAGHEVDLLARGTVGLPNVRNYVIRINPAKLLSWAPSNLYYGANQRWISKCGAVQLKRGRYDAVISWARSARAVFCRAEPLGVPRFLNCGNLHCERAGVPIPNHPWPTIGTTYLKQEYALASTILAASEFARRSFIECGVPEEKVVCIDRGVDLDRFTPPPAPPVPFRVLACGRVCERKGSDLLVEAWKQAALPPPAELWFVGPVDNDLRPVADQPPPGVKFFDFMEDVAPLMRQCNVQVLLSRNEGLAKALLEGAACGLATIATAESGFPLKEGENGYVIADRTDLKLVAEKLRYLHARPDACAGMGAEGRKAVIARFTWPQFRTRFARLIADKVKTARAGGS